MLLMCNPRYYSEALDSHYPVILSLSRSLVISLFKEQVKLILLRAL